jgi:hypothetical protein
MNKKIIILLLIMLTIFTQNTFSDVTLIPDIYKSKVMGFWNFDVEAFMQSEMLAEATQGMPEMEQMMIDMLGSTIFEFTENEMSISTDIYGEVQTETTAIKIVSTEGNRIIVENVDSESGSSGDQIIIIIIDDNHLQVIPYEPEMAEPEFTFFLIRAQ